jgi:hypothetical protein
LKAQWHPIGPEKIKSQEAYLFFYDYFFEAEKEQEISIFNDSLFFLKLNEYRQSRPSYLVEVYLPKQRLYRYYCLRAQADAQEVVVIEASYKQLLKGLVREEDHLEFLKKRIPAPAIPLGYFYKDQFYFSGQNKIPVEARRETAWRAALIERDSILDPFLSLVAEDLRQDE